MVKWIEFADAAPELAARGEKLFRSAVMCLVGTLRADGSPRISPCEVILAEGELMLGMMWRSRKALDLMRDPRLAVHSVPEKGASGGDFKIYGRANEIPDDGTDPTRPRPLPPVRRGHRQRRVHQLREGPNGHAMGRGTRGRIRHPHEGEGSA